ncbi:hypothetical protein J4231_00810 [Candidatus Woesearchaeota archaeon]|nr:hypothetical protein [Candidatus Woesearchaeota archaeon]
MNYKQKDGKVLYGFSQTNLDKTNARLNSVANSLKALIVLFIILLIVILGFVIWAGYNDVLTRLIYGY